MSIAAADTACDYEPLDQKFVATLQARAALAGFELVQLADESWLIARWGMHRALRDVDEAEAFLQRVGAPE